MTEWNRFNAEAYDGVKEADVFKHVPAYGFIRDWMAYMCPLTQGNAVYHMVAALGLVSAMVPPMVCLPDGDDLRANFYGMILGPSALAKKTHAVKQIDQLLAEVDAARLMPISLASAEGILDEIIIRPQRLICVPEGGIFFSHTSSGEYGSKTRQLLTDLFDGTIQQRMTVGKKKQNNNANPMQLHPRLSMLIACTPQDIEAFTLRHDFEAGFMSRFLCIFAKPERLRARAGVDPQGRQRMRAMVMNMALIKAVGPCLGMTPEAAAYYDDWQVRVAPADGALSPQEQGVVDRAQLHARKAALNLAFARFIYALITNPNPSAADFAALEAPWYVELDDVRTGCWLGNCHIDSARFLVSMVGETEDGRYFRRIRNFLKDGPKRRTDLYRFLDMNTKRADMLLGSLVSMGYMTQAGDITGDPFFFGLDGHGGYYPGEAAAEAAAVAAAKRITTPGDDTRH